MSAWRKEPPDEEGWWLAASKKQSYYAGEGITLWWVLRFNEAAPLKYLEKGSIDWDYVPNRAWDDTWYMKVEGPKE